MDVRPEGKYYTVASHVKSKPLMEMCMSEVKKSSEGLSMKEIEVKN